MIERALETAIEEARHLGDETLAIRRALPRDRDFLRRNIDDARTQIISAQQRLESVAATLKAEEPVA